MVELGNSGRYLCWGQSLGTQLEDTTGQAYPVVVGEHFVGPLRGGWWGFWEVEGDEQGRWLGRVEWQVFPLGSGLGWV